MKHLFQKWGGTLPNFLTFSETIYLANLDGAPDRVTSQSSERIYFYYDHKEADTKLFAYIKFLYDTICLNIPHCFARHWFCGDIFIWCDSVSSFSQTEKITTFQTLKNKLDQLTEMIGFGEFFSPSLESPSVVT